MRIMRMMAQTEATIRAAISIDTTITSEEEKHLKRALGERNGKQSRALITTNKACEILECDPVTLRRYEKRGFISAIRYSQRKLRWDLDDVLELRDNGIPIEKDAA